MPIVSHCAVDSENQTHSLQSSCSLGFWITWDRKTTILRSWLGSKSLSMKTFPKSFPLDSHFVSFPPKTPTSPKPSHSSELNKFIGKSNQSFWDSVALAHFQQNPMLFTADSPSQHKLFYKSNVSQYNFIFSLIGSIFNCSPKWGLSLWLYPKTIKHGSSQLSYEGHKWLVGWQ